MANYTQLTREQRYQIKALLKMEHSQTQIAKVVGVHKSTISREIRRNVGGRGYRPKQAHERALYRRQGKAKLTISVETWQMIENRLRFDCSPEQITGWLKDESLPRVSHETIYRYVYTNKHAGGNLYKHLRCLKTRRKRIGIYDRRGKIPGRRGIETRPKDVEKRERLGDWEVDTIIGKGHQGAVVTLCERKSRLLLLRKVDHKSADLVAQAVIDLLSWVGHVKTITSDNGKEFSEHQKISQTLNVDFYFAHPYSSWERGTNENTNGLIRQYLPKNRNLTTVTPKEEIEIMDHLNLRPRKCLGYKTPFEVFFGSSVALTT